jgi:hypothetical protein
MFVYEYEVVYYSDANNKNYHACGYLIAENYKEAMDNMVQYFGNDEIVNVRLKAIAEDRVIIMKEEEAVGEELGNWTGPAKNEWC